MMRFFSLTNLDLDKWHLSMMERQGKHYTGAGQLRLHTLLLIRWIALIGQFITILTIKFALSLDFPFWHTLAIIFLSAFVNILAVVQRSGKTRLHENEATIFLGFDLLQLSCLVYLTGGIENPFLILILAPVTISASLLGLRSVIILSFMAILAVSFLDYDHFPLPMPPNTDMSLFTQHPYYRVGVWAAMMISILFIAAYSYSMARESRRMINALSETQMALAREQKLSDVGMISAALAHELGTPLGTIAVLSREIQRDLAADHPLQEDLCVMRQEINRCRTILNQMSRNPQTDKTPYVPLTLQALIDSAARNHLAPPIDLIVKDLTGSEGDSQFLFPHRPDLIHGLGALLQNALQYANAQVRVVAYRKDPHLSLIVADDGPGFAPEILNHLGEPYLSSRTHLDNHMGLGVFIAKILLERSQAHLDFYNYSQEIDTTTPPLSPLTGAHIKITWHLKDLETDFAPKNLPS